MKRRLIGEAVEVCTGESQKAGAITVDSTSTTAFEGRRSNVGDRRTASLQQILEGC